MKPSDHTLHIQSVDIERRLGFYGLYTSPHKFVAFSLSLSITAGLAIAVSFFPESLHSETYLGLLTRRGIIPYFTLLGFNWGIILLWMKSRKISAQKKALKFLSTSEFSEGRFHADNANRWIEWLNKKFDDPHAFILPNRLYAALASLHALKDPSALTGVVTSHTEADEIQSDESYAFPSMLLYLIPILGFIGTVIGLSASIGGFGEALSKDTSDITSLIKSLQTVTGGLGVAFDTTLFALVCALVLQLYSSVVRSRETRFLEDCTAFVQRRFFPSLIPASSIREYEEKNQF